MHLFEHQHLKTLPPTFDAVQCKSHLQKLWEERYAFGLENDSQYEFKRDTEQKFLKFGIADLKVGKYAGVIRTANDTIHIYPKIFDTEANRTVASKGENFSSYVFSHILWWMSYSKRIRLPKTFSSFDTTGSDFLEVLMYFFAYYTDDLVNNYSFNDYTLEEEDLSMVRGRIKFNEYVGNIGRGDWHKVPCEFSEFQHDNTLNQIILYVTKLLYPFTKEPKTRRLLDNILHQLSEVTDRYISINDCDKVHLNPLYEEYAVVLDYCRMFLSNSEVSTSNDNISVFSFLVNTESLFEDFIQGFLTRNKSDINIKKIYPQKKGYLGKQRFSGDKSFNVKLDYLIEMNNGIQIIADAKYKKIYASRTESDANFGISNSDVFQMISYSYRKDIDRIFLFYPDYVSNPKKVIHHQFDLLDAEDKEKILLDALTLPVIMDYDEFEKDKSINELFAGTENRLIDYFKVLLAG
jgi:5-methylcytosine-specific restriction enzyme subunit McrC